MIIIEIQQGDCCVETAVYATLILSDCHESPNYNFLSGPEVYMLGFIQQFT